MEAKESSTVPAATALAGSKDGPVSDESRLSDARGLAKEAAFLFQSRRLQECIDVLNQLLQKKHDDAKVCGGLSLELYDYVARFLRVPVFRKLVTRHKITGWVAFLAV